MHCWFVNLCFHETLRLSEAVANVSHVDLLLGYRDSNKRSLGYILQCYHQTVVEWYA